MNNILIIDNDAELCDLLSNYLAKEAFHLSTAYDGHSGIKMALSQNFQAIILDVMLPKLNGFEVLKKIREQSQVPILMLTARGNDIDKIIGLEIGADDYLAKPCNPRELLARLKAIIKRTQAVKPDVEMLTLDDISINTSQHAIFLKNERLDLTNAEYNILKLLMCSPGQAFSKEELTEHALNRKYTAFDRSIDVHISNLRNKIGNNTQGSPRISTVRGFGYLYAQCTDET